MRPLTVALCLLATPALADVAGTASVIGGDTLEVHGQRIRLHGIDAPEAASYAAWTVSRGNAGRMRGGPLEGGGVFWRHRRFLAREQVFDGEYLEPGELPNGVSSTPELAAPMSALWPIASALPPKGDIRVAVADFRS